MKITPKVDVIIPNYNETELLLRAVNSVLTQGEIINKIIIIDDGSNKRTIQYLNFHISVIDRVQIIFSERLVNPGAMRQLGLNHSTSDWIAFLDADDFWEQDKIQKQINFALKNNFQVVCSNANLYKNSEKVKPVYQFNLEPKISTKNLLKENIIINSTILIKKECFQKIGGYPKEHHLRGVEDYSAWLRVSVYFSIGFLNETLVNYQDTENSFGKQQNRILRDLAIYDFVFWSKCNASICVRWYAKYYLCRILGRA
jgi:glycosyltransferase involved in cell wall biosynthesis